MHQYSKQRSRLSVTCTPSRFHSKVERHTESTTFGDLVVQWISAQNRVFKCARVLVIVGYPLIGGCSEGAVPGVDGGNWLEGSSSGGTQDSNDTLIPTTQGDTQGESGDDSADLPSIEESSASESSSSSSVDPDDSNEGTTAGSESTSTGDPEGTESDTEDTESTSSTSDTESDTDPDPDSEGDETSSSDSDSQESAEESDSTSSSSSSESEESSDSATSESSSDDSDPDTSDETEDEGTESTSDEEIDCDVFFDLEYRAADAKFTGWTTLPSSVPSEQIVLQPTHPEGKVDFTIQIPCRDQWYVWIRGFDEFEDDSFRVQVDGSPNTPSEFEVDCSPGGNQYRWTRLHSKSANSPPCERKEDPWVQHWDPGNHHLVVYPLNAPVLSRIRVSNDPNFVPQ